MTPADDAFPNPYHRWSRNAAWAFVGSLALALVPAVVPAVPLVLCLVPGTIGATVAGIFAIAFWFTARNVEEPLEAFRRGQWLGRWPVPHARFEVWAAARGAQMGRLAWIVGVAVALGGGTVAVLFAFDGDVMGGLVTGGLTAAAAWVTGAAVRRGTSRGLTIRSVHPVELVVGPRIAVMNGVIYQWRGMAQQFIEATAQEEPPALRLRYTVDNQGTAIEHTLDLPCTAEQLGQARAVAQKLNAAGRDG